MIADVSLRARQRSAGALINAVARWAWDKDGWAANNNVHFGVTTSATEPTNLSELAGSVDSVENGTARYYTSDRRVDGTQESATIRTQFNARIPVVSPFTAGRYLWAISSEGDGDVQSIDGPYLII